MPVTRKYEERRFLEEYEEINEYSPLFINDYEEESSFPPNDSPTNIPFWKKWWAFIKSKMSKA